MTEIITASQPKLHKALSSVQNSYNPYMNFNPDGFRVIKTNPFLDVNSSRDYYSPNGMMSYDDELAQSRFYYRYDPIASTVINRMVDMIADKLRNKRSLCSEEEINYFNGVAAKITPVLQSMSLEYLVSGMAVPDYGISKEMGTKLHPMLGRRRYAIPNPIWIRNPENIILKRMPTEMKRMVYLRIPRDEIAFVRNGGKYPDGTVDKQLYDDITERFPEYVQAILEGKTIIPLPNVKPILRKPMTNSDWPQPFLVPALSALKHKWRIKRMDYSIATRAIEAILHIRSGSDQFPTTDDDPSFESLKTQLEGRNLNPEQMDIIYKLYTNHTVKLEWIYPDLEALLSGEKYAEPNADIMVAMGFSRVLLVGESLRSNSGDGVTSTVGPLATLAEVRQKILEWVKELYYELADANGFKNIAEPTFAPIPASDMLALVQYALEAAKVGILSKDTVAQMFGSDFETERQQIKAESSAGETPLQEIINPEPQDPQNTNEPPVNDPTDTETNNE